MDFPLKNVNYAIHPLRQSLCSPSESGACPRMGVTLWGETSYGEKCHVEIYLLGENSHTAIFQTFLSQEDLKLQEGSKVDFANGEVERARNGHRNDLENILPFLVIGGFYLTTEPELKTTRMLFRIFTAARIMHTLVYMNEVSIATMFQILSK